MKTKRYSSKLSQYYHLATFVNLTLARCDSALSKPLNISGRRRSATAFRLESSHSI